MTSGDSPELLRLLRGRLPSADEIEAIRLRRLRTLVRFAHSRVPYYRRLLDGAGIGPDDIRRVEDLRHVPISTCDDLRAAGEEVYARGIDRTRGIEARTSGSTGRPWTIFRTPAEDRLRRALDLRSLRHAGVRPEDRIARSSSPTCSPASCRCCATASATAASSPAVPAPAADPCP